MLDDDYCAWKIEINIPYNPISDSGYFGFPSCLSIAAIPILTGMIDMSPIYAKTCIALHIGIHDAIFGIFNKLTSSIIDPGTIAYAITVSKR